MIEKTIDLLVSWSILMALGLTILKASFGLKIEVGDDNRILNPNAQMTVRYELETSSALNCVVGLYRYEYFHRSDRLIFMRQHHYTPTDRATWFHP